MILQGASFAGFAEQCQGLSPNPQAKRKVCILMITPRPTALPAAASRNQMIVNIARGIACVVALLLPAMAAAEPIKLKFSFFTSDRSNIYQMTVKPFVDAVNSEGKGLIEIEMYFSGAISKVQTQQPQLVDDGTADLAIIVPGQSPDRFGDNVIMELPGIYRDSREASLVFTNLIEAKALKGYSEYFVVGAFVSSAENIHSRKPVAAIEDLKGLTIRTNNRTEAAMLEKLGAIPVLIPINQTTEAISRDKIDGATFPPSMVFEFGVGRVTNSHYTIRLGGAPTALVMNRSKFDSLPPQAQAIIRKYSGPWLAERSASGLEAVDKQTLEQMQTDPGRKVALVSAADAEIAQLAATAVVEDWAAMNPHNRDLLTMVRAEIKRLRTSN
jgi:TRAP-type C4-dicarboxylate transport system substrate-binding protein